MVKTGSDQESASQYSQPMSSDDEEIMNLSIQLRKAMDLKLRKLETLKNAKKMRYGEKDISEESQELSFSGNPLGDGLTMMEYAIGGNSTMHLVPGVPFPMTLHFKMPANEKILEFKVLSTSTIGEIKARITESEGIPVEDYSIYYAGKALENYRTVALLEVENEATLQMISTPKDRITIYVDTPRGRVQSEVRCTHTALDVKKILESMTNIPSEEYELFKGTEQLINAKTLAYYEVHENEILSLLLGPYQITVNTFTGKPLALEVMQSDSIRNVKEKIVQGTGGYVENIRLTLNNQSLKDYMSLASYGIEKGSALQLGRRRRVCVLPQFQII